MTEFDVCVAQRRLPLDPADLLGVARKNGTHFLEGRQHLRPGGTGHLPSPGGKQHLGLQPAVGQQKVMKSFHVIPLLQPVVGGEAVGLPKRVLVQQGRDGTT